MTIETLVEELRAHADTQIEDNLTYIKRADILMRSAAAALTAKHTALSEVRAELERVKLVSDNYKSSYMAAMKQIDRFVAGNTAAEAENATLREALEPFAKWSAEIEGELSGYSDDTIVASISGKTVTFGDFRRAARAPTKGQQHG